MRQRPTAWQGTGHKLNIEVVSVARNAHLLLLCPVVASAAGPASHPLWPWCSAAAQGRAGLLLLLLLLLLVMTHRCRLLLLLHLLLLLLLMVMMLGGVVCAVPAPAAAARHAALLATSCCQYQTFSKGQNFAIS
jgi:hypothetical protein